MSTKTYSALAVMVGGLAGAIITAVQSLDGVEMWAAIGSAVVAALGGLLADFRDDGRINGSVTGALLVLLALPFVACGGGQSPSVALDGASISGDGCVYGGYYWDEEGSGSGSLTVDGTIDADAALTIELWRGLWLPIVAEQTLSGVAGTDADEGAAWELCITTPAGRQCFDAQVGQ